MDTNECVLVEVGDQKKYLKEKCGEKFKCPRSETLYSVELYTDDPLFTKWSTNCTLKYDRLCPDDLKFYEVCGHIRSECESNFGRDLDEKFCRTYTCQYQEQHFAFLGDNITITFGSKIISGLANKRYADCNGEQTCSNTDVDELGCPDPQESYRCMGEAVSNIRADQVCDLKCDCHRCNDEAECGNMTYGVICDSTFGQHVHAMYMCDNKKDCYNGLDEENCRAEDTLRTCTPGDLHGPDYYNSFPDRVRSLYPHQICAVPRLGPYAYTCQDGKDQINCTDTDRVAMSCEVNGFPTTLSLFAICRGYELCDDGYQNQCVEVEGGCVLHKNQLCDGHPDCPRGTDETKTFCSTLSVQKCVRRVNMEISSSMMEFPMSWVMDGKADCKDEIDEDAESWQTCGSGQSVRYVERGEVCSEVFLCNQDDKLSKFVTFDDLCDKIPSCGIENKVCQKTKSRQNTWDFVLEDELHVKRISYCLQGMGELQHLMGRCSLEGFTAPDKNILGAPNYQIKVPSGNFDCGNTYGELYVYLSCSGECKQASCPLGRIKHNSCVNIPDKKKVYSLTEDYSLTIVARDQGRYFNKYFPCDNSHCVTYDKVCNLVDDCGDSSDERGCANHFKCAETGEYVLKTSVCDGKIDCRDFSDECGEKCSRSSRNLLQSSFLKVFAWLSGVLATILNLTVFITSLKEIKNARSLRIRIDKSLILLVAVGDFLVGVYLLSIAAVDAYYLTRYCKEKYRWLTSPYCTVLGTLSTIGSQLSLFSMAALGISRLTNVKTLVAKDPNTTKGKIKVSAIVMILLVVSIAISVFPLFPPLEDFFVNGLHYEGVTLFTGIVDKESHHRILQSYNGRYREQPISWETMRRMVREMFSQDNDGISGSKVEFYGSDSVCIFKYLVTKTDPQYAYSLAILSLNLVCFLFITSCYTVIQYFVVSQSRKVISKISSARRSDLKLQTKVSIIIATDFLCWIPFIVVCGLHYWEVIDASSWYPVFSVVILPFNSVINPLLYSDMVLRKGARVIRYVNSHTAPSLSQTQSN